MTLIIITLVVLSRANGPPVTPLADGIKTETAATGTQEPASASGKKEENMGKPKSYPAPPPFTIDSGTVYTALLTTSKGVIKVKLDPKLAPNAVNNFVFLARDRFYDDTVFHRILKGFMIQGGDPTGTGTGSPGYRFNDEPVSAEYTRGTIAMANSGPDTNGSQFFIMHADYPLPKNYVIFGEIDASDSASLAVLDNLANTAVVDNGMGEVSKPAEPVSLKTVTIEPVK